MVSFYTRMVEIDIDFVFPLCRSAHYAVHIYVMQAFKINKHQYSDM